MAHRGPGMLPPTKTEYLGKLIIPPRYLEEPSGSLRVKLNELLSFTVHWQTEPRIYDGMNIISLAYETMYAGELNSTAKNRLLVEFEKAYYAEYL